MIKIDFKNWFDNKYFETDLGYIVSGDCLEEMKKIPDKSIDMILCDLPYGTTRNKWDIIIPFELLWNHYERIIKDNGAIVLTSSGLFTVDLINSNRKLYKYRIIWEKTIGSNQFNVNYAPLKIHEDILIFSKASACYVKDSKHAMTYNPQMIEGEPYTIKRKSREESSYDKQREHISQNQGTRYPTDVIKISNPRIKGGHKTQKPIKLFEYLIKTYSNEGDIVLDNTAGAITTGLAAQNLHRNWICIEKEENYCEVGKSRFCD